MNLKKLFLKRKLVISKEENNFIAENQDTARENLVLWKRIIDESTEKNKLLACALLRNENDMFMQSNNTYPKVTAMKPNNKHDKILFKPSVLLECNRHTDAMDIVKNELINSVKTYINK